MVKLYPISGWACGCLLGTPPLWCPVPPPSLGLPILSQCLTEDSTLSSAKAALKEPRGSLCLGDGQRQVIPWPQEQLTLFSNSRFL